MAMLKPHYIILLSLLSFLHSCGYFKSLPQWSEKKYPRSSRFVGLEPIKEEGVFLCALAVAKMLESYYGVKLRPEAYALLQKEAEKSHEGISGQFLREVFTEAGYSVVAFKGELGNSPQGIYYHLHRKHPLIVLTGKKKNRHFLVVTGINPEEKNITVNDPIRGKVTLTESQFLDAWEPNQFFTLLIIPKADNSSL